MISYHTRLGKGGNYVYKLRFSVKLFVYSSLVRRLDPSECPLQMVYDYLTTMGYDDPMRVQQEAANSDLSCMIRFYTGEYVLPVSVVLLE